MSDKAANKDNKRGFLTSLKCMITRRRLGELMVLNGIITPKQLKSALHAQKETKLPLGQIFIKKNFIKHHHLVFILTKQYVLRYSAAFLFVFFTMNSGFSKKARADVIQDVPAKMALTDVFNYGAMTSYPALFETEEKRSENLKAFTKWTKMFDRFDSELKNTGNNKIVRKWQNQLIRYEGLNLKTMAGRINELVNKQRYISDTKNWGKSDYWATPIEFMKRGGDCEDFAIAKYTALRALGVPEERLRVAIVHDNEKGIPHAVLVVYTDQGSYVLDNQIKTLVDAESQGRYRPIFSINRQAWWLHTTPSTVVASVQ